MLKPAEVFGRVKAKKRNCGKKIKMVVNKKIFRKKCKSELGQKRVLKKYKFMA